MLIGLGWDKVLLNIINKLTLWLVLFLLLLSLNAHCIAENNAQTSSFLNKIRENHKKIKNYTAMVYSEEIKGERIQKRLVRSYFSIPWLLRNEIVAGTEPADAGSEMIYAGGEKMTGHKGGMVSFATVSLYYDSPMATTLLGLTFREMIMKAMLDRLSLYEKLGTIEFGQDQQAGLQTVSVLRLRLHKDVILPEHDRIGKIGATHEEIYIDKERLIPVGWAIYVDKTRVRMLILEKLLTNVPLDADIFQQVRLKKPQYIELNKLFPPREWRPDYW
ncbi:hypothetical protein MNBD_GAMMA21-2733 [hydrothermal vent metagenome]|uniref:Uncharacterized protein n=1 Tax=hydrothermal vent metagenome TaxID=652676 RepID=A0A3B1AZ52_9ZZZZ